jgi:hypothetical protein
MSNIKDITEKLAQFNLADGKITRLNLSDNNLYIYYSNWEEEKYFLLFNDVIGMQIFDIIGIDLSHVTVDLTDDFIRQSCENSDSVKDEFYCFSFWSAWSDFPIARIIAQSAMQKADME